MNVDGKHYRTIWTQDHTPDLIKIIDQTQLPHEFKIRDLRSVDDVAIAIRDMQVRGAGLIGATAGYGMQLAAIQASKKKNFDQAFEKYGLQLKKTRPTAVNLATAVDRQIEAVKQTEGIDNKVQTARRVAQEIADEDAEFCRRIGEHGFHIIEDLSKRKKREPVNILTHCNAGWLAFVDYGSATSPIYAAYSKGINVHVWVDETRPRNQGAMTAWELGQHGVPHTYIVDNAGGHIMQQGLVDMVIVGTDRTTRRGDVANKIGTYIKALAAKDNNVPFYVALPSTTFDWNIRDGLREIPIENRDAREVNRTYGYAFGKRRHVLVTPEGSPVANYAFDVTPNNLVTGLITERGVCRATETDILKLYSEQEEFLDMP